MDYPDICFVLVIVFLVLSGLSRHICIFCLIQTFVCLVLYKLSRHLFYVYIIQIFVLFSLDSPGIVQIFVLSRH